MNEDITVILNGYKRPHVLKEQYEAVIAQTMKPKEIMFWHNHSDLSAQFDKDVIDKTVAFQGNSNLGVWARFAYALMAKTKYVCILDDDTIPGNRWLENCYVHNKTNRGLYGTVGIVFNSTMGYDGPHYRVGWPSANDKLERADIVGHSWFFEKELLTAFWRELPDPKFVRCGEDIHFSYVLQKYMGLETYVPPHPKNDLSLWGSQPDKAWKYGTELVAISNPATNGGLSMNEYVMLARKNGYRFVKERI
jgi:hypothetical protein